MKVGDKVEILLGEEWWLNVSGETMEVRDNRPGLVGKHDVVTKLGSFCVWTKKHIGPFSPLNLKIL